MPSEAVHMHGLLTLLPHKNSDDDTEAIDFVKNFACLREVAASQFMRAMSLEGPTAIMYYADVGSANYPAIPTVVWLLTAAFFHEGNGVATDSVS